MPSNREEVAAPEAAAPQHSCQRQRRHQRRRRRHACASTVVIACALAAVFVLSALTPPALAADATTAAAAEAPAPAPIGARSSSSSSGGGDVVRPQVVGGADAPVARCALALSFRLCDRGGGECLTAAGPRTHHNSHTSTCSTNKHKPNKHQTKPKGCRTSSRSTCQTESTSAAARSYPLTSPSPPRTASPRRPTLQKSPPATRPSRGGARRPARRARRA
jgi:hypothetical protein